MLKKGLTTAVVAACVMGATSTTNAHQTGSVGAVQSDSSLFDWLLGGPKGPTPPPKFDGSDPETNPPGPRPPPKLDGSDPVTNPPGPKPPPR